MGTRIRVTAALAVVFITGVVAAGPAAAYTFPSTNDANRAAGHPHVNLVSTGPGTVTLQFVNPTKTLAFFEYRIDSVDVGTTPHPVITGDVIHPGVCVDGRTAPSCSPGPIVQTFSGTTMVEVRLALGSERDWDFDWTPFAVGPLPPPIGVAVGDSTVIEGNGGQNTTAHFGVRLSEPAPTDSFIWYHTVDGSAVHRSKTVPNGDFTEKPAPNSKLKIPAGKVVGDIGITVYTDTAVEGNESFTVVLDHVTTTPTGSPDPDYGITRSPGTGTIIDDDPAAGSATIAIGATAVPEGNATQDGQAKLAVRLSQPMPTAEYVYFHTVAGSATAGTDFTPKSATSKVKIPAGKVTVGITTKVKPDVSVEGNETYTVVIDKVTPVVNGAPDPAITVTDGVGEVTILDDDA